MKTNIYPPPIYRLDKINNYIKAKLDDYLRDSKELSKGAFEKTIFIRMFFENELEQSKELLKEVGLSKRIEKLNPYSMSLARSCYGYTNDYELNNLEKEFFKFYIISIERHLEILEKSLDKNTFKQAKNIKTDEVIKYNWFIIGLKFANGEMKALLKTHNNNATKIANELGNKDGFRPYISESIGVKKYTSEKSIYSDYNKMKTIIEYCKAEKTEIQSEFLMYFNKLEQEQ